MAESCTLDILALGIILVGTAAYLTKGKLWGIIHDSCAHIFAAGSVSKVGRTRNIVEAMNDSDKNCIVFYGSQTGTAENYAFRLAKEGKSRFGLSTMIANLEEYDFDTLDSIPSDKVVIFVLATYGEGQPTDNAVDFYEFITGDGGNLSEGNESPLHNLNYVTFGLGNNTYEHYNSVVRNVNKALMELGAHRIGEVGEGDDGAGTTEEDFLAWKDHMWDALNKKLGLKEIEAVLEPIFSIQKHKDLTPESGEVYLGEPNKLHLEGAANGQFNAQNPYIAPIAESYELFSAGDRNCLHMEIDIDGSDLKYETGDHIAIWPANPSEEINRFLDILNLSGKRHNVITVTSSEPTIKVPFPNPTTYDAILRYYLEICAPVSRQFVSTLATFAPNDEIKAEMNRLGGDKDYFHERTSSQYYTITRFLAHMSKGEKWSRIPFSAFIEGLTKLQPRYYSISSSSLVQPWKISITAVVESRQIPGRGDHFYGLATNYLLALKQKQNNDPVPMLLGQGYELAGPRNKYDGFRVPIHIRHSNFKLPSSAGNPIIMVGPGTGVAPFRGFIQERAKLARDGVEVGKTLLFFGCRNPGQDFIYRSEWKKYKEILGDKLEIVTSFSRESSKKVYVQHRLKEWAKEISGLLSQQAHFYVCGDATNMACQVNAILVQIVAQGYGVSKLEGEEILKDMRAMNRYQEDVW